MTAARRDAAAVLLPICDSLTVEPWLSDFLRAGGRSVLLASSAGEYTARRISDARRAAESAESIRSFVTAVAAVSPEPVLVAADAEPTGVQRLEHLLPPLPGRQQIGGVRDEILERVFFDYAQVARDLGVTLFLGPVVDHITGKNAWLQGRIMADDLDGISQIAVRYASAVQAAGVAATAKHFPGHSDLPAHPVHEDVTLRLTREHIERNLAPFRRLVEAGVSAVMVGPVTVEAIDPGNPAASSPAVVNMLRNELGFSGLIISDDLDAASTMKGRSLAEVAVSSAAAGVELLLIPGGDVVSEIAEALSDAVAEGRLPAATLAEAAVKVRALAARWAGTEPRSAVPGPQSHRWPPAPAQVETRHS